ncbi:lipase [Trichophyton mentagrophytes]|uniref:Extracellular triacylglycerol lipase n=2 Tax=Trichophyton interdigitale TaxID=101480 RepID=A0A9P4YIB3_9EURO|nr:hypothetical protein H101_02728 [Trichophyton interdigitale H6]KAF3896133.1 Extracellular triacylglycerol lipase [Trichophyton interdigitale]KDB25257.1 hypothetical protein H109_02888 [Trichophyton interdigitale MR816]GBF60903.1 lipase [Trichophyton mentagrophytes]KAF3898600.1 Extracellular triacylglycerol lipase [Trichophyton interdigitale]
MVVFSTFWFGLLFFIVTTQALPSLFNSHGPAPFPSEDPFYQPPQDYECAEPGTILKQRKVPNPIVTLGKIPVRLSGAYHVMYRTSDNFRNATVAVTTILIPEKPDYNKLLSFQVAEDAASPNCGVSYAIQRDHQTEPKYGTIITRVELFLIVAALKNGWVVTTPDFEGLEGSWLANHRAGYAVLDGIRATLASNCFTGIAQDATVTMWGYSGGSLASGFAVEVQPCYAPELKIAGAALGGTVPNITSVVYSANKSIWAGLLPAGIYGWSRDYPLVETSINVMLKPERRKDFLKVANQCFAANLVDFAFDDIFAYFKDPSIFNRPEYVNIINENSMGKRIPQIPLFVYKSKEDEVSPVEDTDELVKYYCDNGANVHYNRDLKAGHLLLALSGAPSALNWLADRFEGKSVGTGCRVTEEFMGLTDPQAYSVLGLALIAELLALLRKVILGPTSLAW